jgi:hypothetical protein
LYSALPHLPTLLSDEHILLVDSKQDSLKLRIQQTKVEVEVVAGGSSNGKLAV